MSSKNSSSNEDSSSDSDLSVAFNTIAANQLVQENRCSTTQKQQPQQLREVEGQQQQQEDPANAENEVETTNPPETPPAPETAATPEPPRGERPNRSLPRRKQKLPLSHAERLRREVYLLQKSPYFMIPRLPFGRVVREIIQEHSASTSCITRGALEALQTASEMFLTQRFQDSYLMTMHRGRVTLEVRDMALMAAICKLHGQL